MVYNTYVLILLDNKIARIVVGLVFAAASCGCCAAHLTDGRVGGGFGLCFRKVASNKTIVVGIYI